MVDENKIDLIGQKFGRLIIVKYIEKYRYLCQCDCGNKKIVRIYDLKSGHTKSCGCLNVEKIIHRSIKHGHQRNRKATKIYNVWAAIIQRCTNANDKHYKNYGGRGITICKRWRKFENFNEDMGKGWKRGLTIERKNNEKGYYPDNCEWVTQKEQNRNRRNNLLITCFGKTKLLIKWSEETGIPYGTLRRRIFEHYWSIEKALTMPVKKYKKRAKIR